MAQVNVTLEVFEKGKKAPNWNIESDLTGEVSAKSLYQDIKQTLILVSKEALAEELAKGFDPKYQTFVDGSRNKKLEDVFALGKVSFVARAETSTLIAEIYKDILDLSRIKTGKYYTNNTVFVNDIQVANSELQLKNYLSSNIGFKHSDVITFVNLAPYARKLERHAVIRGNAGTKKINTKADKRLGSGVIYHPNGAYVLAQRKAQSKYGKNAYIKFVFKDGGTISNLTGPDRTYKTDSGVESRIGKPYFYPSIVVRLIGEGIK
jgi:hypothetical protein